MSMGYPRAQVLSALRASFNNPTYSLHFVPVSPDHVQIYRVVESLIKIHLPDDASNKNLDSDCNDSSNAIQPNQKFFHVENKIKRIF